MSVESSGEAMFCNSKSMEYISKFLENASAYWTESELYHSKHYWEMKIGKENLTCLGEL